MYEECIEVEDSRGRKGSVTLTETDEGTFVVDLVTVKSEKRENLVANISSWDEGIDIIEMIANNLDPEQIALELGKPVFVIRKNITAWDGSEVVDFRMSRQDSLKCCTVLRHMEDGSWERIYTGETTWKPVRDEYFTSTIDANMDLIIKAIESTPDGEESSMWLGRPAW